MTSKMVEPAEAVSLEDLFQEKENYHPSLIEAWTGITPRQLDRCAPGYLICRRSDGAVAGHRLVNWIHREKIPYTISESAKGMVKRRRLAESRRAAPPAKPKASSVLDKAENYAAKEVVAKEREDRQQFRTYLALLERFDDPRPEDAKELSFAMADLNLSRAAVERDAELVRKLRKLEERHASKARLEEEERQINAKYPSRRKELEDQLRDLERSRDRARSATAMARQAIDRARNLARSRPAFFAEPAEDGFPRLLTSPETKAPSKAKEKEKAGAG